jgi:hypothetical protein
VIESQMFHSTLAGSGSSSQHQQQEKHRAVLGDASSVYMSRSIPKPKPELGCFLRLFIESVSLVVRDDRETSTSLTSDEIVLRLGSAVVSMAIPAEPPSEFPVAGYSAPKENHAPVISATFSAITVLERVHVGPAEEGGDGDMEEEEEWQENVILTFSSRRPDEDSLVIPDERIGGNAAGGAASSSRSTDGVMLLSGPLLEITATLRSFKDGGTEVAVDFEHAKGEFSLATLTKWASILDEVTLPQTSASSPFAFACKLAVKSIEVILLVDASNDPSSDANAGGYMGPNWGLLTNGLGFAAASNWSNHRWKKVKTGTVRNQVVHSSGRGTPAGGLVEESCRDVPGSLRVVASGIVVSISSTNVSPTEQAKMKQFPRQSHVPTCATISSTDLKVAGINGFLRLGRARVIRNPGSSSVSAESIRVVDTWELGFLRILGDGKGRKISVGKGKYVGPEGIGKEGVLGEQDAMGNGEKFVMPTLNLSDIVVVKAHIVRAGETQWKHPLFIVHR